MNLKTKFKNSCFYAFLITLLLILLQGIIYGIFYSITNNDAKTYFYTYLVILVILAFCKRKTLLEQAKSLKKDIKDIKGLLVLMYILFYSLMITTNLILYNIIGNLADNESLLRELLVKNPFMMSMSLIILGPITEELIFRFPYNNIKTNKKIKFCVYTLVFALCHIVNATSIVNLLFIIPYIFLSLSIGYSYYKTDNIYTSMFFHIFNNALSVIAILIGG